jgi:hypothetical protein
MVYEIFSVKLFIKSYGTNDDKNTVTKPNVSSVETRRKLFPL